MKSFMKLQGFKQLKDEDITQLTQIRRQQDSNANLSYKQDKTHQSSYRRDIDGLRTIAVGIVIYFHMFPQIMVGGFIGVDIFFVISGYLISGIIIKEYKKNKFTYANFYSRRIKRIFPALIVVLIVIFMFICSQLNDRQIQIISRTMSASTIFGANIQILTYEKGYFDPAVLKNPLLHLWSLGVQQQFYIIWPLVISLIVKKFSKIGFQILLLFSLISFIFNVYAVYTNPKFAFYFPLCRFWQMAIGGLIVYRPINISNNLLSNILSIIGITAIVSTVWIVNQDSLFPGYWALIPTLSAALIILAGSQALVNKYILSSQIFVFIGKISYPLYLWHWPLLVFSRILYPGGSKSIFSKVEVVIIIAFIFTLLTYYLIQNPLRFKKQKYIVWILAIFMFIIGATSYYAYLYPQKFTFIQDNSALYEKDMIPGQDDYYIKNGKKLINSSKNKNRLPLTKQKLKVSLKPIHTQVFQTVNSTSKYYDQGIRNIAHFLQILNQGKNNTIFIIGDSHVQQFRPRFLKLYEQSVQNNKTDTFPTILSIAKCGWPFVTCFQDYHYTIKYIKKHKPSRLFFNNRWAAWFAWGDKNGPIHQFNNTCQQRYKHPQKQSYKDVQKSLNQLAASLKQIIDLGTQVYVGTVAPEGQIFNPRNMVDLFGVIQDNVKPLRLSQFKNKNKQFIQLFEGILTKVGVKLIDFSQHHCWEDICQVLVPKGLPVFVDDDHYRYIYAKYWASSVDFLTQF